MSYKQMQTYIIKQYENQAWNEWNKLICAILYVIKSFKKHIH